MMMIKSNNSYNNKSNNNDKNHGNQNKKIKRCDQVWLVIPSMVSKCLWTHLCINTINKTKLQWTVDITSFNRTILQIQYPVEME